MANEKRLIDADEAIIDFGFEWDDIPPTREEFVHFLKKQKTVDAVPVVRCRDCIHAVEIEKDYIRKLFIDGTKQCELGRADTLFGYSIITNDGFCDSGERKDGDE